MIGSGDVRANQQLLEELLGRAQTCVLDLDVAIGVSCVAHCEAHQVHQPPREVIDAYRPPHVEDEYVAPLAIEPACMTSCAASGIVMK